MKVKLIHGSWLDQTGEKPVVRRCGDQFELSGRQFDRLVKAGAVAPLGDAPAKPAPEPAPKPAPESKPEPEAETVKRPAQAAPKAEWVKFAVSQGLTAKEAEGMDKRDLIALAS